jgi:glycosyltransferase involved in cell wall biosynthesis
MSKIKVAFCTNGIFPEVVGGMQRHSKLLIDELCTYPDVEIVVIHPHKTDLFPQKNVREISIEGMDSSKNYLLERHDYSKRVYGQLQNFPNHIIYSQGPSVWYRASDFTNRLIINPHGLEPFQAISLGEKAITFPLQVVLRILFKKARYVVSLGGGLTSILKPLVKSERNLTVLPNAVSEPEVSAEKEEKQHDAPLRAAFVGRFAANKGIHILMDTIDRLNDEGFRNKISFHLAGKGPLYESYKESNQRSNVEILGFVSDEELQALYRDADVFVLPTLFEGMPTVVLEAMSRALPIIVTDVGATAELVAADNGYLIKKNSVLGLKNALMNFISAPRRKRMAMGARSLEKVRERFTWERVAQKHYDLFKALEKEL